ncbi:hypothetical protein J6590_002684, partial [Homalodisca vitripennis]
IQIQLSRQDRGQRVNCSYSCCLLARVQAMTAPKIQDNILHSLSLSCTRLVSSVIVTFHRQMCRSELCLHDGSHNFVYKSSNSYKSQHNTLSCVWKPRVNYIA